MNTTVKRLTGEGTIAGNKASINSCTVEWPLNGYPSITGLEWVAQFNSVVPGTPATLAKTLSSMQEFVLNSDRSTPDVQIDFSLKGQSGESQSLKFSGMLTNPGIEAGASSFKLKGLALHTTSITQAANLSIYTIVSRWLVDYNTLLREKATSTHPYARLVEVLTFAREQWAAASDKSDQRTLFEQLADSGNKDALGMIDRSKAAASAAYWPEWEAFTEGQKDGINTHLLRMLQSAGPNFTSVLQMLCQAFRMAWYGDIKDNLLKFVSMDEMLGTPVALEVPAGQFNFTTAYDTSAPVQQIFVEGRPAVPWAEEAPNSSILAAYPPDGVGLNGRRRVLQAPEWLTTAGADTQLFQIPTSIEALNFSFKSPELDQAAAQDKTAAEKVLERYAKYTFIENRMSNMRTMISMPLNLDVRPGTRYRITNDGDELFTGTAETVRHDIKVARESEARTSIQLGLVAAPDVDLLKG